ncbi:MAG: GIN domain-containing protein [Caulobacteraceae bacterium]
MIRSLVLIAAASFVLAVACFAGAAAMGARFFAGHPGWVGSGDWSGRPWVHGSARGWGWTWPGGDWRWRSDFPPSGSDAEATTRQIAWTGGDSLSVDLPADVTFTQAPGPGKLVITGPKYAVDRVELWGSDLRYGAGFWVPGRVTVVMTAPDVHRFSISGDGTLAISNYDADNLDLRLSGAGKMRAAGRARSADVDISGAGAADLSSLKLETLLVSLSGVGRATAAPTAAADVHIAGAGVIDLLSHPPSLTTDISGAGRIVQSAPSSSPG